jgi:hypothetical protein
MVLRQKPLQHEAGQRSPEHTRHGDAGDGG